MQAQYLLEIIKRRKVMANLPGSAQGYRGTFAMQHDLGGPPFCAWWVLTVDMRWHDAVRGDGHSYVGPGPGDIFPHKGESLEQFRGRVKKVADLYG